MLCVSPAAAQTISATTYPFTASSGAALEDMSSGTAQLVGPNLDGGVSAVTAIGFDFWFVGARHTQFSVNSNGLLRLGPTPVGIASSNNLASSAQVPQIAPYWDDLWTGTNGKVHYRVVGAAPARKLVVEWKNIQVPKVGSGQSGAATFQCWLHESTGKIEFVYGSGLGPNTAQGGASIGFGNSASEFASVTTTGPTVAYGIANNANAAAIASGTAYAFTPVVPAGPTGLSFSGVTAVAMTLHWTDNATDEVGYALYRSTDSVTYAFVTQLPANATSTTLSGLDPSTTYYWIVRAVSEGALSSELSGSQMTNPANLVVTADSGNWSSTVPDAPWPGGVIPTSSDSVVIADGHTVTVDVAAICHGLTVGQGGSGTLQFEASAARTLTVGRDVLVSPGGVFRSAASGTQAGHVLSVGGSVTNNGTLDFSTNGVLAGAGITFTGDSDASLSGTGGTTDLRSLTVDKGTGTGAVLTLAPASFSVRGATTSASPFLTLTKGTLRISGSFAMSDSVFAGAGYVIGSSAGLWLDNPNFEVIPQSGSPLLAGLLRVSAGTFRVGTSAGNSLQLFDGCTVVIEGGAVEVAGRFAVQSSSNRATYTQTGGTLTAATVGQSSTSLASFDLGTAATSSAAISGGTIVLQMPSTAASGPRDYRNGAGTQAIMGGSLQLGNAATTAPAVFYLTGTAPSLGFTGASSGHSAVLAGNTTVVGTTVVGAGDTLKLNASRFTQAGGDLVNHGVITSTAGNSELQFLGTAVPQTYSGAGLVQVPLQGLGLTVDNPAGVTIDPGIPQNLVTLRVNLARGVLQNSQLVTIGDSIAAAVVQVGAAGLTEASGSFDAYPTLKLGPAGVSLIYLQSGVPTTTGLEVPPSRTVQGLTINNPSGVVLAGGALTLAGSLTLTVGVLQSSSASTLTLANSISSPPAGSSASYVEGPLAIEFAVGSATNRTYAIGAAGAYRPLVLKSVNTGGVSRVFTAEVIPGPTGGTPVAPLQSLAGTRYWRVQNTAGLNASARVNLTFGADDNVDTLANLRVAQAAGSAGSYNSLGGVATGTTISGTVESDVDLVPGSDYFAIGSIVGLATTWDGGAGTSNWGDSANWSPDGVPTPTTNVTLALAAPATIDVNGAFSVANLTVGSNATLAVGADTLSVTGTLRQIAGLVSVGAGALTVSGTSTLSGGAFDVGSGTFTSAGSLTLSGVNATISGGGLIKTDASFTLSGGSISLGGGTLEVLGNFTRTAGFFSSGSGTTLFSGTNAQTISAGVVHYDLILRNGGVGGAKRFAAPITHTVNNDFTVDSTAQLGLTASEETHINVWGNFGYSGVAGGPNVGSIRIDLKGNGKVIRGAGGSGGAPALAARAENSAEALVLPDGPVQRYQMLTDPSQGTWIPNPAGGKPILRLQNTYELRRAEVERLLAASDPNARLEIDLDDVTIVRNPASYAVLATAAEPKTGALPAETGGGVSISSAVSPFPMPVTIDFGGRYSLGENVTVSSGQTLTVRGRLDFGTFTIGGAGGLSVDAAGTASTTANHPAGFGATVITTGSNSYSNGATIEYAAPDSQTINAANHPAAARIRTSGSGIKTLDGDKFLTAGSGFDFTTGSLFVEAGSSFADGGHRLTFAASQFANVIVHGTYVSTGAGSISYESGAFDSNVLAADGTTFGDLFVNFDTSTFPIDLSASGTANLNFRNIVFGGTAGGGTAGGTLRMNESGTTNVTVTGNVTIAPGDATKTGGGFGGTSGRTGLVTLLGNLTSSSVAPAQPILDNAGTNTMVLAGTARETLSVAASATSFTGSTLRLDSPAGLALGGSGLTYTLGNGGTIQLGSANLSTGSNTLSLPAGSTLTRSTGRVVGRLKKPIGVGPATAVFEVGIETGDLPVTFAFGNVNAPGNLVAGTTGGEHPAIATGGIAPDRAVNGFYTLASEGVAFDSCAVTFGFAPATVDPGANPDSFVVWRYDAPTWSPATVGTRTPTSTQVTSITSFSDFVVGEARQLLITATAGANGVISPGGFVTVSFGADKTFDIIPNVGHYIVDVLVDGVSVGVVTSYTFTNVTSDHTISATFAPFTYTLTASAGPHGSISPSGATTVSYGDSLVYTMVADPFYAVGDVLVDGASVGPVTAYTYRNIDASHTISVSFIPTQGVAAVPPDTAISTAHPCVTVPVDITRTITTQVRRFSVTFSLSPNLVLCSGLASITEGTFLNSAGATTFSVQDLGGGTYQVDDRLNGANCGAAGLTGNLFNVAVTSSAASDSGTVTITAADLRTCNNQSMFVAIGDPVKVAIDNTPPAVSLLTPDGGEVVTIGMTHPITWTTTDNAGPGTVDLAYSTDSGLSFPNPIASGVPDTASYSWVVPNTRSTTARVRVTAHDVNGNTASDASNADFEIRQSNVPPVLAAIGNRTVNEDSLLSFTASASDSNLPPQTLTFSLGAGAPAGAVIDSATGAFTWTPGEAQGPGDYPVTVHVTDNGSPPLADAETLTVHVDEVNVAPVLAAIGNRSVSEETLLSFTASATDADLPAQALAYSLGAGAPAGASIDSSTGAFTWTPSEAQGPGDYPVTVRVTDNGSPPLADAETLMVHVDETNAAPVLAAIGNQTVSEGSLLSFAASATDPDPPGQTLTYSLDAGAPAGASIDSTTGAFTWTPSEAQGPGDYPVTVRVTDNGGPPLADAETLMVHVDEVNAAPVLAAIGDRSVNEGTLLSFTASATDADLPAQTLTYSLDAGAPAGADIDGSTGVFSWTPTEAQGPGDHPVTVRVTDNGTPPLADAETLMVHVDEANAAPVLASIGNRSVSEGSPLSFTASATDADLPAQTLAYSLDAGAPEGASIDSSTGAFTWTPSEAQGPGDYPVTVRVTDNGSPALDDAETITIHVDEANTVPVLAAIGNRSVSEGTLLSFAASATDADVPAQTLAYSLDAGAPAGASIDGSTGAFSWTPSEAQGPGDYAVTVRVTDDGTSPLADAETLMVHVDESNEAPLLAAIGNRSVSEETLLSFIASATDADLPAQTLGYSLDAGAPEGASIDSSTGAFSWTPSEAQGPGDYPVTVRVTDNGNPPLADAETLMVHVDESNEAPLLAAIGNRSVSEGSLLSFTASATDGDIPAQTLAYSLDTGAPAGASIDASTGEFTWTPSEAQGPGDYPVTVRVTDNGSPPLDDAETITIHVDEANVAPVLAAIGNQSVSEGSLLSFTASATDGDLPAQTLTFSLDASAPAGASIDGSTGVFSWTPTEAQGPGDHPVTVRVTDGGSPALGDTETIAIHVDEVNVAPVLAVIGNRSVSQGSSLSFTASATDADLPAQALTYSLDAGAPAGASIDGSTGAFSWTPSEAQGPGDYPVTVRVTDDGSPALDDAETITISVDEPNAPPVLAAIGNQSVSEGSLLSFTASATDSNAAQTLTYSLDAGAPAGASIDGSTGAFTWTPTEAQGPGDYPVTVRVTDNGGTPMDDAETITIHADEVNVAPTLGGVPASATIPELAAYGFAATASDGDVPAQTLTFSLLGAPAGASIDSSTGVFSWTPSEGQGPGVYSFSVRVGDGVANTDSAITLTVEDVEIAAIADLAAVKLGTGNDSDGTTKISLSWSPTAEGTTVEVYRAAFGSYPEYDDGGGQVPATPSYPPEAPWVLTPIASPGQMDEPPARDFYYYVAFVHGTGANVSAASNQTSGTLNYHLGDVSDAATAGQGDNLVNTADISLLGAHYGLSGAAVAPFAYLDVGPTTDTSPDTRPTTDDVLDFEDLVLFVIAYDVVSSPALPASAGPAASRPAASDELRLEVPGRVEAGQSVTARLSLLGTGKVQGLSVRLDWDPAVVRPVAVTGAGAFQQAGGVVLSPRPGTLDAALLGARPGALAGEWGLGTLAFEAIAAGDPHIRIAEIRARDASNRRIDVAAGQIAPPRVIPTVTALARPAPNPFRQSTAFSVSLAQAGPIELVVYAVDGRRVRTLLDETREPGEYRLTWNGRDARGNAAAPGVYFVRMVAGSRSFSRTIVLVR